VIQFLKDIENFIAIIRYIDLRDIPKFVFYVLALILKRLFGIVLIKYLSLKIADIRFRISTYRGDLGFVSEVNCRRVYEVTPDFVSRPGDVCVDVGANIGCFSLYCAQTNKSGQIIAVEPDPETFSCLIENLRMNHADNVIPLRAAISNKSENITLNVGPGSNMARVSKSNSSVPFAQINVPGYTLDDLVKSNNLGKIDLLKIDVEGHEVECLKGARNALRLTQRIVLEFHSEQIKQLVIQILSDAGFGLSEKDTLIYGVNLRAGRAAFK